MSQRHTLREGECIDSVAAKYGLFPQQVWDDAGNAELKKLRKDPNILQPGDVLVIPDKQLKEESGQAGERHRFRRKGVPARFQLTLDENGKPRADVEYILEIDGELHRGKTDSEGKIDHPLPPAAKRGKLILGEEEEYELDFGSLDPVSEESGVDQRLANLGYGAGDRAAALKQFQQEHGLEMTGEIDDKTRDALVKAHGS